MQSNRNLLPQVLKARNPKQYPWAETKVRLGQCSLWRLRGELLPGNTRILGLWRHPCALPPRSHCLLLFCVSKLPQSLDCHTDSNVCFYSTPPSTSLLPGCPGIELNSDTIYLEGVLDPTGQGPSPAGWPFSPSPKVVLTASPSCHRRFWWTPSLGLITLLEQLTKFKETLCLLDHPFTVER